MRVCPIGPPNLAPLLAGRSILNKRTGLNTIGRPVAFGAIMTIMVLNMVKSGICLKIGQNKDYLLKHVSLSRMAQALRSVLMEYKILAQMLER